MVLWEEINSALEKEIEGLKESLAYGHAPSYDMYRQIVGKIEGILYAKEILTHIVKTRLYSEDEDYQQ